MARALSKHDSTGSVLSSDDGGGAAGLECVVAGDPEALIERFRPQKSRGDAWKKGLVFLQHDPATLPEGADNLVLCSLCCGKARKGHKFQEGERGVYNYCGTLSTIVKHIEKEHLVAFNAFEQLTGFVEGQPPQTPILNKIGLIVTRGTASPRHGRS